LEGLHLQEFVGPKAEIELTIKDLLQCLINPQFQFQAIFLSNAKGGVILNDENHESRRLVEQCYRASKTLLNPIIDWTDGDVWDFLKEYKITYCSLYNCGYARIGCIGCPMNTAAAADLERYPTYKRNYIRSFDEMIRQRIIAERPLLWKTGEEVMNWWITDKAQEQPIEGQEEFDL